MAKRITSDQAQQRVEALQKEAGRLAAQAKDQLDDYARTLDLSKQVKFAQTAVQESREQLQQSASHASGQVVAAMAAALEDAAGQLRTHTGAGPAAKVAQHTAGALEHGSEYLQPWGTRSVLRRLMRIVRHHPIPALLIVVSTIAAAYLANRRRYAMS